MGKNSLVAGLSAMLLLCSCASQQEPLPAAERLTVGQVQKEIRLGMSGAQVVEVLGSPNIVSSDADRNEIWVYDKISTQITQQSSSGGIWLLIVGTGNQTAQSSRSQNTLTIVIKFDKNKQVRDFSYHSSKF